jgi:hypothetical protein
VWFTKSGTVGDNHLVRACGVRDKRDVEARQDVMELVEKTEEALMA